MGLNRTIRKTLDEHSNLSVFINRMTHDTTHEVSCMLSVSVDITPTLLQIQELCSSPEFGTRRLKRLLKPRLESLIRPKDIWVVKLEP